MTAEVGVMSKLGVALAADSAVTVGNKKIFNSANKLFALSKVHPVGIMVYSSAEFMGVPWEIIIKRYREVLGNKKFKTLQEYAMDFIKHVTVEELYKNKLAEEIYVRNKFRAYLEVVVQQLEQEIYENFDCKLPDNEVDILFSNKLLENVQNIYDTYTQLEGFDDEFINNIIDKYRHVVHEEIVNVVNFDLSHDTCNNAEKLFGALIQNSIFINDSGIVVAGYGEDDIFPKLYAYTIEGCIEGVLRYKLDTERLIGTSTKNNYVEAAIVPFAQQEMVHSFIGGITPQFESKIVSSFNELFSAVPSVSCQLASLILSNQGINVEHKEILDTYREPLEEAVNEIKSKIFEDINNFKNENNIYPLVNTINSLPKDELAALAETLVNLTSVKRKISLGMETVGGPIDVALITKGEGFIWIKRKHYFNPELNSSFFKNYFRGVEND